MALLALVPSLPAELRPLFDYLLLRDVGLPAGTMALVPLAQTAVGGMTLDRIAWGYSPGATVAGRAADGFVVWWQDGQQGDPVDGGVCLSAQSRQFSMLWPAGAPRSYAVAPYRMTYQGEELGPKQQHASWLGAS